ncbi:MAG TPA: dihydrodipicolinate synthase family protein [Blastocatellia bacterium]|nr:dihydrodipicolinate synthase family protein [Blastocatellia bacterium]
MAKVELKGIMPPLTTPFDERGDVDFEALARNLQRYNTTGLAGYVLLGSNGEAVHLTREERFRVIETVKANSTSQHLLIAGVNEFSSRAALEASRHAQDAGADAVLVITPYFYKSRMNADSLSAFFNEVADASPLPVLIYNVPQNTGVTIDSSTIATLAAHENIVGVKDSAGNFGAIAETIRLSPPGFAVMSGNGGILYPALAMGATGAVLAVACAAPRACVELFEAVAAGDHNKAKDLQRRIAPVSHAVTAGFGVAGLKVALDLAGFDGGFTRSPLGTISEADSRKIATIMKESRLFSELD